MVNQTFFFKKNSIPSTSYNNPTPTPIPPPSQPDTHPYSQTDPVNKREKIISKSCALSTEKLILLLDFLENLLYFLNYDIILCYVTRSEF